MEEGMIQKPSVSTIIIGVVMIAISFAFFILLGNVSENPDHAFGFVTALYALGSAIVATLFLVWLKRFMRPRPYLGVIIGAIILASFEYSLFRRFQGPYTTVFGWVIAIAVIVYVGFYFIKFRNNAGQNAGESFDDR